MSLMEGTQMEELTPEQQAKKAILHMLSRIRDHEHIGWYCGFGTQAFDLLTEAAATLCGKPVREIREAYLPKNPKDPRKR